MSKPEKSTIESVEHESIIGTQTPELHLKKRFNFWTAFGIAICTSGAVRHFLEETLLLLPLGLARFKLTFINVQWEGWTASIAQGLSGGGSVALLWGWVFVSVGITCMACALAEFVRYVNFHTSVYSLQSPFPFILFPSERQKSISE